MLSQRTKVNVIRQEFIRMHAAKDYCKNGTLEIINASFISDKRSIFGEPNMDYIEKELEWYTMQSLSINDMALPIPKIWEDVATIDGEINSNYGWCILHKDNGHQMETCKQALIKDWSTRQACMIYMRPSMHVDSVRDGMSDFMCTFAVQLLIRKNKLHYIVNMRSNDAVFGYNNDRAWHNHVWLNIFASLQQQYFDSVGKNLELGDIHWNANSLHIYPRHFHLIEDAQ